MRFIPLARARPFMVGALALAFTALAPSGADAQAGVLFTGTTQGCFGAGCTPVANTNTGGLFFSGGTFNGVTNSFGFYADGNNLGQFTLATTQGVYSTPFTLQFTFTSPTNGQQLFTASVLGEVLVTGNGSAVITYTNPGSLASPIIWFDGPTSDYGVWVHNSTSVQAGQESTGYIDGGFTASTVPEPMSMILMGTGLAGLAVVRRRRQKLEQAELV